MFKKPSVKHKCPETDMKNKDLQRKRLISTEKATNICQCFKQNIYTVNRIMLSPRSSRLTKQERGISVPHYVLIDIHYNMLNFCKADRY